jgi:RPA family protein
MEPFKKTPTIRMLAAEVRDTTVEIQSGGDQYAPTIHLSPTGAEVNRVLIAGTAVKKEDVGTDNSFWRIRVADPTGAIFVYAGQYQPEAAKVIQNLEVPCFVIVSGKLSYYTPEQGGNTIVSLRIESIASVSIDLRDTALADIAHHTVKRILDAKKDERLQEAYPGYDNQTLTRHISALLYTLIEDEKPAINAFSDSPAEKTDLSTSDIVSSIEKSAKEWEQMRGTAINSSNIMEAIFSICNELKLEGETSGVLQESEMMVLDIIKTHRPQGALARDTIQNVLRALGYATLDVDSILAKLKTAGEIIEPKNGFFRAA